MTKYRAQPTVIDGIRFASKAEARRYQQLRLLERGKAIEGLVMQPRFVLAIGGVKVCTYVGDFQYTDRATGSTIIEDVKGLATPVYKIKKALMRAIYGVEIHEVQA